ncbi:hypothetical protein BKA65DRAFT_563651 [Rhexocercosporidium sp. MPI-PUGE-AT-0058]|nr:hypothetical protein BKA65DRAFT_563651 [Rhexocercosporidium sp. MPI-PUGE-AT-0058]
MDDQGYHDYFEGDCSEEEGDQTQTHQVQRDEIAGTGYVEPEYGYYCGMCKVQKRVAVLLSKEVLIRHGTSDKGLGHRLIDSMFEGFVGCAIFEDRRVGTTADDQSLERLAPNYAASTTALASVNGTIEIHSSPEAEHASPSQKIDLAPAGPAAQLKKQAPGPRVMQARPRSKKKISPSPSHDFDFGTNNSDNDCEELSTMELDQINRKFPITPPMASPNLFQQGTSSEAGLASDMTTLRNASTLRGTTQSSTTPRKRGAEPTEEGEAEAGKDGNTTRQPNKVRRTKEIFEVQMTGVAMKAQPNHMVGNKRTFESLCNTFQAKILPRSGKNREYKSMTASSPTPASTLGTPASFAGGFDSRFTLGLIAGGGVFTDEPEEEFHFNDPRYFREFGKVFVDEEMDFFSPSVLMLEACSPCWLVMAQDPNIWMKYLPCLGTCLLRREVYLFS